MLTEYDEYRLWKVLVDAAARIEMEHASLEATERFGGWVPGNEQAIMESTRLAVYGQPATMLLERRRPWPVHKVVRVSTPVDYRTRQGERERAANGKTLPSETQWQ